tara:strand:+ start:1618 stop:1902 length:285 start_codon:yes stop_codon:yes gene_type:complete
MDKTLCRTCGLKKHRFNKEIHLSCVPNFAVQKICGVKIPRAYRKDLFAFSDFYTGEEILGSYLGHNPLFPSYADWKKLKLNERKELIPPTFTIK